MFLKTSLSLQESFFLKKSLFKKNLQASGPQVNLYSQNFQWHVGQGKYKKCPTGKKDVDVNQIWIEKTENNSWSTHIVTGVMKTQGFP